MCDGIFHDEAKVTTEVCGATSRMMKDESIVGERQVDGTRLLIYIYT